MIIQCEIEFMYIFSIGVGDAFLHENSKEKRVLLKLAGDKNNILILLNYLISPFFFLKKIVQCSTKFLFVYIFF